MGDRHEASVCDPAGVAGLSLANSIGSETGTCHPPLRPERP
jgi:hypothetical protein